MSTWVLLRGLMREARHWENFPQALQQAIPVARVVMVDLPGNGVLHRQRSPARIEDMLEACRMNLRTQGLPPPYHLLALSLGGMVGALWRKRYPAELSACVLINTSMRPFSPFWQRLRPRNYFTLVKLALVQHDLMRRERIVLALTSNRTELQKQVLNRFIQIQLEAPVSRVNAIRQLWAAMRFTASENLAPVPTLILASAADHLVDAHCSTKIAQSWRAALCVHPDAGHDLTLDEPVWVAQQVAAWLLQVERTNPIF